MRCVAHNNPEVLQDIRQFMQAAVEAEPNMVGATIVGMALDWDEDNELVGRVIDKNGRLNS
jgi:hypothetical protein